MDLLLQLVRWEMQIFLVGLAAIVFYQLLTGRINTRNLLYGRISGANGGGKNNGNNVNAGNNADGKHATKNNQDNDSDLYFSPERVQLLLFTLGAALYYMMQTITTAKSGKFPDIPEGWPAVMGGSNAIFVGGKVYARWFANPGSK